MTKTASMTNLGHPKAQRKSAALLKSHRAEPIGLFPTRQQCFMLAHGGLANIKARELGWVV